MTVTMRPVAPASLAARDYRMLIDGSWTAGAEGRTIERASPAHGVVVSRYAAATRADA
ncbi:MAG TPA: sorbosone dehydrogenase, partial [Devosia sp.]